MNLKFTTGIKYRSGMIAVIMLLAAGVFAAHADTPVTVKAVLDGDTVILKDGRHVRYLGINAPEIAHENRPAEPFGEEAKTLNRRLVLGKKVRLVFGENRHDRYGRLLAFVFLENGMNVNEEMLRRGLAYYLFKSPFTTEFKTLLAVQQSAILSGRGMWKNLKETPAAKYIGNRRSKRFHAAGCPYGSRTKKQNRMIFKTKREYFLNGYAPCKTCLASWLEK